MPTVGEGFELRAEMPTALREVILEAAWDLARLHELELPGERVPIRGLAWQLSLPWWRNERRPFAVRPQHVHSDPARHREQWERTMNADLRYPIHLVRRRRWVVLDGVHRLLKAQIIGLDWIPACLVTPDALGDIWVRGS